jgi:uncharacterized protein
MQCRIGCGACCIAPSISSSLPGMPLGKSAGVRCVQLTADHRCALFGLPTRPQVCADFSASEETCGGCRDEALQNLARLEEATAP